MFIKIFILFIKYLYLFIEFVNSKYTVLYFLFSENYPKAILYFMGALCRKFI